MQGSSRGGQLTPLVVGVKTGQKSTVFSSIFCVIQLECVIIKIKRSQKISTSYVMYILFIVEKTKQKGSIDPFGSSRIKTISFLA